VRETTGRNEDLGRHRPTSVAQPPGRPESPDSADTGRILHRALFTALGLLPRRLRNAARRHLFDALFSLSADPWGYQATAYEQRKREHLLAAVPDDATTVLEFGCADGHNLGALARRYPHMRILGTDVSSAAVGIAADRTLELGTVRVLTSEDFRREHAVAPDGIDCVILSEVLYYLGTENAMREALAPVRDRMTPGCRVVLLHGCTDAPALHARAMRALGVSAQSQVHVDDPERVFTVTTAQWRG
jgi:SAM-dependent methyltransferase